MILNQINLSQFQPKFRQALLFSMIEGLTDGGSFTFIDSRSAEEVENELGTAGLVGYQWQIKESSVEGVTVVIRKKDKNQRAPDSYSTF